MTYCDLTLPTAGENLACDEALLQMCESAPAVELLRVWEPLQYFVVVGYGNKVETEVNIDFCRSNNISVLRRCTGGGAVLQGPGCLNFSLILRIDDGPLRNVFATNQFILQRHQAAMVSLLNAPVQRQGQTDLAIGGLKFCGNAQRRCRNCLLFHGSFLLHMDVRLLEKVLPMPSHQPAYRANRSHADFLTNVQVSPSALKACLARAWEATLPLPLIPFEQINLLVRQKYARPEWNLRF